MFIFERSLFLNSGLEFENHVSALVEVIYNWCYARIKIKNNKSVLVGVIRNHLFVYGYIQHRA